MNIDDYQQAAAKYDFFEATRDLNSPYLMEKVLGFVGEAGEVADRFKKCIRDENNIISDDALRDLKKELGDTLWYLATIARYLNIPMSEIAQGNLNKLQKRLDDGTLHWRKGDTR